MNQKYGNSEQAKKMLCASFVHKELYQAGRFILIVYPLNNSN